MACAKLAGQKEPLAQNISNRGDWPMQFAGSKDLEQDRGLGTRLTGGLMDWQANGLNSHEALEIRLAGEIKPLLHKV